MAKRGAGLREQVSKIQQRQRDPGKASTESLDVVVGRRRRRHQPSTMTTTIEQRDRSCPCPRQLRSRLYSITLSPSRWPSSRSRIARVEIGTKKTHATLALLLCCRRWIDRFKAKLSLPSPLSFFKKTSHQDLATLDVTKLTPLSPEVISRQATINIGERGGKLAGSGEGERRQTKSNSLNTATMPLSLHTRRPCSP